MRAQDYFYYMDLLDECGYYKEADEKLNQAVTVDKKDKK